MIQPIHLYNTIYYSLDGRKERQEEETEDLVFIDSSFHVWKEENRRDTS